MCSCLQLSSVRVHLNQASLHAKYAQYGHRAGPEECQEFMNQLGPDWGGGVAFTFKLKVQDMVIGEVVGIDMA